MSVLSHGFRGTLYRHFALALILLPTVASAQAPARTASNGGSGYSVRFLDRTIDLRPYFQGFPYVGFDADFEARRLFYFHETPEGRWLMVQPLKTGRGSGQVKPEAGRRLHDVDWSKRNYSGMRYDSVSKDMILQSDEKNDEVFNLYRVSLSNGAITKLTNVPYIYGWSFSKDNRQIGYIARFGTGAGEAGSMGEGLAIVTTPSGERSVSISMADRPAALVRYTVSGTAEPLRAGRAVVKVQRRTADGWTVLAKDRTNAQGRYAVPVRTNRPGKHTLRAVAMWSSGPDARSSSLNRTVRAVANAKVSGPLSASQVPHSWRRGCPVAPSGLRKIHINRITYKKLVARGTVVVRAREVGDVVQVLTAAIDAGFPIRMMKPADHFYAGGRRTPMESDKAAMRAGNTSAFNCRPVVGNPYRVSQHSYGNAIDINTIENPYVTGSQVYPPGSREYLRRSPYRRGMILRDGVVANRMRALGWLWGARWSNPDYQHFSSNGG